MTDLDAPTNSTAPTPTADVRAPLSAGVKWATLRAPLSSFVLLLMLTSLAAGRRHDLWVMVVLAVGLGACAWWLDRRMHAIVAREPGDRKASKRRAGVALLILTSGAMASGAGIWLAPRELFGTSLGGLAFAGIAVALVGAAGLLSEARMAAKATLRVIGAAYFAALTLVVLAVVLGPGDWWWKVAISAFVLGEVATEFLSERADGWSSKKRTSPWVLRLGLAVTGGSLAWLGFQGAAVAHVLVVGLILLAVAWVASSDNDAVLVAVPIFAVMLLWSTSPRADQRPVGLEARSGESYVLVLGDSYISGEGAETYLEGTNTTKENASHTSQCRQSASAWPWLLVPDAPRTVPDRLLFVACSGAVTENISTEPFLKPGRAEPDSPSQLAVARELIKRRGLDDPALIIVGIGGNDAGFSRVGTTCVAPGNCAEVFDQFVNSVGDEDDPVSSDQDKEAEPLADIGDDLTRAYTAIADEYPGVPVVATAYPRPVDPTKSCDNVLLNQDERKDVDQFVQALNGMVRERSEAAGFQFLDTTQSALEPTPQRPGARLCDEPAGAGLNFVALNPKAGPITTNLNPKTWTHNSFHPNRVGHERLAEAARQWFTTNDIELGDTKPAGAFVPPELVARQGCSSDGADCDAIGGTWANARTYDAFVRSVPAAVLVLVGWWLVLLWFRPQLAAALAKVPGPVRRARERMGAMQLTSVNLQFAVGPFGAGTSWEPNEDEQRAAFELLIQLGTRTTTTPLAEDAGLIREALTSLYNCFDATREILSRYGPAISKPGEDRPSLADIAVTILNVHLRPVLSTWHPTLKDYEAERDRIPMNDRPGPTEWERAWPHNEEVRAQLNVLRVTLRQYLGMLGEAADAESLATSMGNPTAT